MAKLSAAEQETLKYYNYIVKKSSKKPMGLHESSYSHGVFHRLGKPMTVYKAAWNTNDFEKDRIPVLVTLIIPKGTLCRFPLKSVKNNRKGKCRCKEAYVESINSFKHKHLWIVANKPNTWNLKNTKTYKIAYSDFDKNFFYKTKQMATALYFDEYDKECSNGIHFFLTKEEAKEYLL